MAGFGFLLVLLLSSLFGLCFFLDSLASRLIGFWSCWSALVATCLNLYDGQKLKISWC